MPGSRTATPLRGGEEIVRVVQAGLGIWGRSWSGLVAGAPGVELAAAVDPDHVDVAALLAARGAKL
ncbi:MAG TPA: hypothetical protein VNT12_08730 [Rubrobacter sp.]|nr:hypothetical protein [Rubrobacter sp.]